MILKIIIANYSHGEKIEDNRRIQISQKIQMIAVKEHHHVAVPIIFHS